MTQEQLKFCSRRWKKTNLTHLDRNYITLHINIYNYICNSIFYVNRVHETVMIYLYK